MLARLKKKLCTTKQNFFVWMFVHSNVQCILYSLLLHTLLLINLFDKNGAKTLLMIIFTNVPEVKAFCQMFA